MKCKIYLFLVVISTGSAAQVWYSGSSKDGENRSLAYLGSVEDKMYFFEEIRRTWQDASSYCYTTAVGSSNMELATVETEGQAQFLQSQFTDISLFRLAYWIGARDVQHPRALSWDDDDTEIEPLFSLQWRTGSIFYQLCGEYFAYSVSSLNIITCQESSYTKLSQTFCQVSIETFCPNNPEFEGCKHGFE